jgi:LCP family protein required for cell wall assembly
MFVVALLFLAPFAVVAWYAWDITNAIDEAQSVSVVQLPERSTSGPLPTDQRMATPGAGQVATPVTNRPESPQQPTKAPSDPNSLDITVGLIRAGTGSQNVSPAEVWPERRELTVMVLGVDTRSENDDQNADVIILARLDLQNNALYSVSIPRDLQVEIPGHGPGKINGAYQVGLDRDPDNRVAGIAMMRDTLEYNFGVFIDDYVMIDFEGFRDVVDAVGGIEITVPEQIVDEAYPTEDYGTRLFTVEAGRQHMDGETALAYARTRHQDSDDKRRERQMLVIQALLQRGQQVGSLTRVSDMIGAVSGAALTSLQWEEQLALASMALRFDPANVRMANLEQPVIVPGTAPDGAWIYTGDMSQIAIYIESALSGEVEVESTPVL